MLLGSHVSISGGLYKAFGMAQAIGGAAMQIFTKNASRWETKPLQAQEIEQFKQAWKASAIQSVVAHDSYLINLAAPEAALWEKSQRALRIELERCEQLGVPYLVMHPGSHVGSGEENGLKRVAEAFNIVHEHTPRSTTMILIETTAGQGTNLGYRFEQLAEIFRLVQQPERLGVCFDTCHAFAAGYELRTEEGYRKTFEDFDNMIGLDRLKAIHLNDSVKGLGSRVDRHHEIGQGAIGLEGFRFIMNDRRFESVPKILETPKGDDPIIADQKNLRILRELIIE